MAIRLSTGLRNFMAQHGSVKKALQGGVLKIYSGSQPASPDSAVAGTLLCTVTLASGTLTAGVRATAQITVGGGSGTFDNILVDGVSILDAAVTFATDLTTTAALIAQNINAKQSVPKYEATSVGPNIIIKAMPGTGTGPNLFSISCSATTLTATVVSFGSNASLVAGVAQANGLTFGSVVTGVLSKSVSVWSGVNAAGGTAGCFRVISEEADSNGTSTTAIRLDGSIATSGADVTMGNTALTSGATLTIDQFDITVPAS